LAVAVQEAAAEKKHEAGCGHKQNRKFHYQALGPSLVVVPKPVMSTRELAVRWQVANSLALLVT
jgi:hypothetical protein